MNKIDYNKELDCTGLNCPLPILKMEATDPGSINDVNSWTRRTGNELVSQTEDGDIYIFYIKKS